MCFIVILLVYHVLSSKQMTNDERVNTLLNVCMASFLLHVSYFYLLLIYRECASVWSATQHATRTEEALQSTAATPGLQALQETSDRYPDVRACIFESIALHHNYSFVISCKD